LNFDLICIDRCNQSDILLMGRDKEEHERYKFIIEDFFPYFYVRKDAEVPESQYIKDVQDTEKKGLLGNDLKKVVLTSSKKTPDVRDMFEISYEADILYNKRFRYDVGIFKGFKVDDELIEDNVQRYDDVNEVKGVSWRNLNGY